MLFVMTVLSGIAGFLMFRKKDSNYSKLMHFAFLFGFFEGAVAWVLTEFFFDFDTLKSAALCTVLGIIMLSAFWCLIRIMVCCKQPVLAKYDGYETHSGYRGVTSCVPKFCYEWQGIAYQEESAQVESKRFLRKMVPGETYTIHIDPHRPNICVANRRPRLTSVILLFVGLFYFVCGVVLTYMACKLVWQAI